MADPRYGSSPEPSAMRPQRGSRAISTMGANVQWRPAAAASRAATRAAASTASGSHEAASPSGIGKMVRRSEEHTSELQSRLHLVCRLLLEKKKKNDNEKDTRQNVA